MRTSKKSSVLPITNSLIEMAGTKGKMFDAGRDRISPLPLLNTSIHTRSTHEHDGRHTKEILHRLYEIAKPEMKLILASSLSLGLSSMVVVFLPVACGRVIDGALLASQNTSSNGNGVVQDSDTSSFVVTLVLFVLMVAAGFGIYAKSLMLNIAGNRIVCRIREQLFASMLTQDTTFFDKTKSGDLLSRLVNDAQYIKTAVTVEAVSSVRSAVMTLGSICLLVHTSPTLALISMLSIPPVFVAGRIVGRTIRDKQREVQELHGKATNVAEEALCGIQTVQQFVAEKHEYDKYSFAITHAHEMETKLGRTKAAFEGIVYVAANAAILLVLGYGGNLVVSKVITAGELTGFLMYSLMMAGSLSNLSTTYTEMMKAVAAAGRVLDIIDRDPIIPTSFRALKDGCSHDNTIGQLAVQPRDRRAISVHFQDVDFAYPERNDVLVLGPKFSLTVNAGENIALVGSSGSGKTTAGLLLTRLYSCSGGKILLNNENIANLDTAHLRRQIGVVSQETTLFAGTIAENIRYGRQDATEKEVIEAAEAAHVMHFADTLPKGLDTQVGDRGGHLSGGQKQRISFARTILKDPPIVILDEATSALDSKSEYHVHQALHAMMEGRTVISIAHRLSTIKEANRIAVLQEGKIVEIGTFDELVQTKGPFHTLMEQQMTSV